MPMSSQASRVLREAARSRGPVRKPDYDCGYLITPTAAIWQGEPSPTMQVAGLRRNIRWAKKTFKTSAGDLLAVELTPGGAFRVCVELQQVRTWRPWNAVSMLPGIANWVVRDL